MTFGKDFNAEQRAAFDAMSAERGSGMNASLLNQDRSIGNSDGQYYYNAIRDEAIKPNNILNGYLGVQPIPNLMANGSSTRGSRGNISSGMTMPTLQERGIGTGTQGYGMGVPTLQEQGIGDAQQYLRQDMMANGSSNRGVNTASNMMASGSNNGRGVDTSLSNTMGRDIASGMGDGLNNVMSMTQGIQSKYGNPNDRSVQQIMSEYNVNNAENAFQGTDNNRTFLQKTGDAIGDRYSGVMDTLYNPDAADGGSGYYNSLRGYPMRLFAGGDVSEDDIAAHIVNKKMDTPFYGDGSGLTGYKHQNMKQLDGSTYIPVSDNPSGYHFLGGKDAGLLSGDKQLPGGGIPMALGAYGYQTINGLLDGTIGKGSHTQAMDNIRGVAASGNADALSGILDRMDQGKARDEVIKQRIADKTFVPGKKAPAYEPPKQTVADRKGYTPQPKAKAKVKVDYNKNTPAPTQKKQSRAGAGAAKAKITRTTGSRGGRGNVAKKRRTGGR